MNKKVYNLLREKIKLEREKDETLFDFCKGPWQRLNELMVKGMN